MTQTESMAAAQQLKAHLEARGVRVSIELQADVRGLWDVVGKRGVISHHTASHISQGLTPLLALVKRGRTGVPGPLANGYGGRDLVYRILTMGKANHAGTGGPLSLGQYVPKDYGNLYTWGTEYEGGYESWDDVPGMRDFMARSNAALLEYFGFGLEAHGEHKTWAPTRKIDRLNYTTQSGRDEIAAVLNGGAVTPLPVVVNQPQPVGTSPWAGKDPNASYANGSRVLRLYSAGTDVQFAQRTVGATPDGYYGNATVAAVKAWQGRNGLVKDGIFGPRSWAKALTQPGTPTGVSAPAFPLPSGSYFGWKSGPASSVSGYFSHRDDLRRWQQRMKDRGWNIIVDGLYGPNTNKITLAFQREKGLEVDGKIGPATWGAAWTAPIT